MALLMQLQVWADGHDFVIATTHVNNWTCLCYCNHTCGQMDMTLLLQLQVWAAGHDLVTATTSVSRYT